MTHAEIHKTIEEVLTALNDPELDAEEACVLAADLLDDLLEQIEP